MIGRTASDYGSFGKLDSAGVGPSSRLTRLKFILITALFLVTVAACFLFWRRQPPPVVAKRAVAVTNPGMVTNPASPSLATQPAVPATPVLAQIGGCPIFPNDSILVTPINRLPVSAHSAINLAPISGTGAIWSVSLGNPGRGYQNNDVLEIVQPGAEGGATLVTSVGSGGAITGLSYAGQYSSGVGYRVASGLSTTGGHGAGATMNVTQIMGNTGFGAEPSFGSSILFDPPFHKEKAYYGSATASFPTLIWPNRKREGGWNESSVDGADHHMTGVVVDKDGGDCGFYDTYNERLDPVHSLYNCQDGSSGCNTQSFLKYSSKNYAIRGGTDAAGLPLSLVLRAADIKNNTINYPVRLTLAPMDIQGDYSPSLWPAIAPNNGLQHGPFQSGLPYGARLRLKASFNTSGYSPYTQNILNAFKREGLIVADRGSIAFTTDLNIYSDPDIVSAVYSAAAAFHGSDLEEVDESCLMANRHSYQVKANNTCLSGAPLEPGRTSPPPVAIGLLYPVANAIVNAKSYTHDFSQEAWVVGSSNQSITWTLASGPGSITPAGVYTAPAASTISAGTNVALTAAWAVNPGITSTQWIKLWPASRDGNFRVATGQANHQTNNVVDSSANTWLGRAGLQEAGIFAQGYFAGPAASLASHPEANVYYTLNALYGGDWHFRYIDAPGNYRVRFMTGTVARAGADDCSWYKTHASNGAHGPLTIGVNGQIDAFAWDWYEAAEGNGGCNSAFDYYAPAQATTGTIDIWYGPNWPDSGRKSNNPIVPQLQGLEILPDSSAPHIAIDTGLESWSPRGVLTTPVLTVHPGSTYQFHSVGWYMPNAVTWAASYGSISSTGLYKAPASDRNAHKVTITATSTQNRSITATATINVPAM